MMTPENQDATDSPISRTRQKKEDHARQILGERLAGCSEEQLERLGLPDEVREAVSLARKTIPHSARHRQMKYIGALLRRVDTAPIEKTLDDIARGDYDKTLAFKKLETWRNQLREGNLTVLEEILADYPMAQRQQLSQLARNAKKEFEGEKATKASKALFRYLKEISEK